MFAVASFIRLDTDSTNKGLLRFSLSWKGSWKNDISYDGVYLFAKYKLHDEYGYKSLHIENGANISLNGANSPVKSFVAETGLGLFVFPSETQEKTDMSIAEITVPVFAAKESDINNIEDIQIFALEMVYVAEGSHYIGDSANGISKGGKLKNCLYTYPNKGAYLVSSEAAITFAPEDGKLYCDFDTADGREENDRFEIPATFPKGFNAFWYMKYSLTQGQFVQFMNCLTREQQQVHCMSDLSTEDIPKYYAITGTDMPRDRCEVYCSRFGNKLPAPVHFYTAAPNRSMNATSWADTSAFACFAGLRPMTELEYEKACRGPLPAVAGEFAWGSTKVGRVFHFDGVDGSGSEKPVPQKPGEICNCNYGTDIAPFEVDFKKVPDNPGWIGPVTAGLFENAPAVPGISERERIGASYYGIMELTGNVWENLVSVGRAEGRSFLPRHGTGELTSDGCHEMDCWPDAKTGLGVGVRGGVFVSPSPAYLHMALRVFGAHTKSDKRYHGGIRVGY